MELKYGDVLVDGIRLDNLANVHIPVMTQDELGYFVDRLQGAMDALGIDRFNEESWADTYFKPAWQAVDDRYNHFAEIEEAEIQQGVASGKYIRQEYRVYQRDVNALSAVRQFFGDGMVNDVFVDRQHLEHLRHSGEACGHETVIMSKINHADQLELDVSGMNMIIVFTNGRKIEMTNSEWGSWVKLK
jgi:hypothetical protein